MNKNYVLYISEFELNEIKKALSRLEYAREQSRKQVSKRKGGSLVKPSARPINIDDYIIEMASDGSYVIPTPPTIKADL